MDKILADPPEEQSRLDPIDANMEERLISNRVRARRELQQHSENVQSTISNGERRKHELLPPKSHIQGAEQQEKKQNQISDMTTSPVERPGRRVTRQMHRTDRAASPLVGAGNYIPFDVGPKWSNPVVIGAGKKRAIVDYEDLHRLNDGEFLNDNLIEFYINWLQDKNPTENNQVHFFSTHFYSALTAQRSRINHKAVERWTKQVDIFSYDFVVVPVNEAYHWYLALICNLPNLKRELDVIETSPPPKNTSQNVIDITASIDSLENISSTKQTVADNVTDVVESRITNDSEGSPPLEVRVERIVIDNKDKPTDHSRVVDDITDSQDRHSQEARHIPQQETPARRSTPASTRKGKSRIAPPPKKYPTNQPTIVIIDSMSTAHSNTIRNLKEYLVAEAKAKRGMEIEREDFQGINAKRGIPMQGNFADCGLFLCGYIEKFLKDPRLFATKLLRQEFSLDDWGDLRAARMRGGIRSLLMKLYEEQEAERRHEKTEKKAGEKVHSGNSKEKSSTESKNSVPDNDNIPIPRLAQIALKDDHGSENEEHASKNGQVEASTNSPVPTPTVETNWDDIVVPSTPKQTVKDSSKPHLDNGSHASTIPVKSNANKKSSPRVSSQAGENGSPEEANVLQLRRSASEFFDISSTTQLPEPGDSEPLQPRKIISGILSNFVTLVSTNSHQGNSLKLSGLSEKAQAAAEFTPREGVQYRVEIPETPPRLDSKEASQTHKSPSSVPDSDEDVKFIPSSVSPLSSPTDLTEPRRSARRTSSNKKSDDNNNRGTRDRSASPSRDRPGWSKYRTRKQE
jgi:Ulp1 protease family, C-terminal catalytic domain